MTNLQEQLTPEQIKSLREESLEKGINPKDLIGARKVPLALIPYNALIEMALAMQDGANKYGPFNWREIPIEMVTYLEAGIGHFLYVLDGQDVDIQSKVHHLGHAMACAAIVLDAIKCNTLRDNRYTAKPEMRGKGRFSRDPSQSISHIFAAMQAVAKEEENRNG